MPGTAVPKRTALTGIVAIALASSLITSTLVASASTIGTFSSMSIGDSFADGWTVTTLKDVNPTRFDLVNDGGNVVVRATADNAAASLARTLRRELSVEPSLSWRWRIDRVVEKSDIKTKQGDDFAARLYVFFDFPLDRLSLVERTKLRLARWWYGDHVPAAALCYVWANGEPPGTTTWNAYTSRARMIVLRNADSGVGDWAIEKRDLAVDFRNAFGDVPPVVTGIAIAADTDQTGESVIAWFGDIELTQ